MERRELLKMIAAATGAAMIGMPAFGFAREHQERFIEACGTHLIPSMSGTPVG